jgi:hypothetical protein
VSQGPIDTARLNNLVASTGAGDGILAGVEFSFS